MFGVYISGSECVWKTFSIGLRSRQNSVFAASAMDSPPFGRERVSDVESRASLSDVLDESEGARTAARAVREPAARGARVASSGDRPAAPPATDRNGACRMAIGPGPVRPPG